VAHNDTFFPSMHFSRVFDAARDDARFRNLVAVATGVRQPDRP